MGGLTPYSRIVQYTTEQEVKDYFRWRQVDSLFFSLSFHHGVRELTPHPTPQAHINNMYNTCFWSLVLQTPMSEQQAHKELSVSSLSLSFSPPPSLFSLTYQKTNRERSQVRNKNSSSQSLGSTTTTCRRSLRRGVWFCGRLLFVFFFFAFVLWDFLFMIRILLSLRRQQQRHRQLQLQIQLHQHRPQNPHNGKRKKKNYRKKNRNLDPHQNQNEQ